MVLNNKGFVRLVITVFVIYKTHMPKKLVIGSMYFFLKFQV